MSAYEQYLKLAVKPAWYFKGMSEVAAQNWVGEQLYPLVHAKYPTHAGKITGMLLEGFSVPEVYALLSDETKRNEKIEQAEKVLCDFAAGQRVAALQAKVAGEPLPLVAAKAAKPETVPAVAAPSVVNNKGDAANGGAIYAAMMAKKKGKGGRR
jgi:hypothetical protein